MQNPESATRHSVHPGIFLLQLVVFIPFTVILVGMDIGPTIVDVIKGNVSVHSLHWSWIAFGVLFGVLPIGWAIFQFVFSACVVEADSCGIRCNRLFSSQQICWADVLMFRKSPLKLRLATATTELNIPLIHVARSRELSDFVTQWVNGSCIIDDDKQPSDSNHIPPK